VLQATFSVVFFGCLGGLIAVAILEAGLLAVDGLFQMMMQRESPSAKAVVRVRQRKTRGPLSFWSLRITTDCAIHGEESQNKKEAAGVSPLLPAQTAA
jgi:hypothetical protein